MKIVIVAGGNPPSFNLLNDEIRDCDFLIAADKGGEVLYRAGISPNILLGDFDSIDEKVFNHFKTNLEDIEIYPKEKDFTDTELALIKALEKKAKEIVFLGCTGSRLDHMLANLGLLETCLDNGVDAYIKDDNNCIFLRNKNCSLKGEYGQILSFQAFKEEVEEFNIYGAKYDLRDYRLQFGDPRTVSNEFLKEDVRIEFKKGIVMVMYSKD
ncbi:thiamine diphosphokinase [Clostridium algidicarnis]|uniref:thiamine diphosphokinase n=1 Tax=Clostridium algidicarnis TaxID=37659 RepID=UPI001C0C6DB0|nr:thiamine diphosphokinase [Clostridium algidicarnis]MBU3226876.1 thiamine diphosphokinase [Clostridium algidicarnis]MBU3250213.1 thiamine diphosphokinase [Clostridium algidicarnis]